MPRPAPLPDAAAPQFAEPRSAERRSAAPPRVTTRTRASGSSRAAVPARRPRVPFTVLVIALIGGGLVLLLALNMLSAANELRRHDLATADVGIAARVQQLRVAVAAASAPGNIAGRAAALGMVPATNPAFLVVGADGSVRVLGRSGAATAAPLAVPPAHPSSSHKATAHRSAGRSTTAKTSAAKASAHGSAHAAKTTRPATATRAATATRPAKAPQAGTARKSAAARKSARASASPSAHVTATPTPTPTVTLPGGDR